MRMILATVAIVVALTAGSANRAVADPYRWCAEYGDDLGGSSSCYFVTLAQCQAAISGNGGFCRHNSFYTGPDAQSSRRKSRR